MSVDIHSSSVVSSKARIADGVRIGPFCLIEDDVEIGTGTQLLSHVVLGDGARIGNDVRIHAGAVISTAPQDLKYAGEPTTAVVGDRTVVRECATINRGTVATGTTIVGSDGLLMAYAHVAHDCVIGNKVILANSVNLGGHCELGDWVIIGGVTAVHQFSKIGEHAMVGGFTRVVQDVPPYTLAAREPLKVEGLNLVGLRRRGFTRDDIAAIEGFYDIYYRSGRNTTDALKYYEDMHPEPTVHAQKMIAFIRSSTRGLVRSYAASSSS